MTRTRALVIGLLLMACGQEGPQGPPGPPGPSGAEGTNGAAGAAGAAGVGGAAGAPGIDGTTPDAGGAADAGSAPPPPTSGTRIKAKTSITTTTTTTSDGAKTVVQYSVSSWFDALRNEPCAFQTASDGKTRCLPTLVIRDYSGGSYFQDAACSQPLFFTTKATPNACAPSVTPPPPAPKYLLGTPPGAVCNGQGVRLLGTQLVPAGSIYFKSGVSCVATSALPAYYDYFTAGAEIAPTEFVESTTTTVITE